MADKTVKVEFEGVVHEFPADITQQEIQKALASQGKAPAVGTPAFEQGLKKSATNLATGQLREEAHAYKPPQATGPRFFRNLLEKALPSTVPGDYLYPFLHPIDTAKNLSAVAGNVLEGQGRELATGAESLTKGMQEHDFGTLVEGLGHTAAGLVPIFGPPAAAAGEQIASGDVAGGLGSALGLGTAVVAPELAGKGLSKVGKLRLNTREIGQFLTRSGAKTTTKPLVEKYLAKSAKAGETFRTKAAEVIPANARARELASRREGIGRSLEEGSARLGERVEDLDSKLRAEGNEKYATVRQATAQDPGVSPIEIGQAVEHAQSNILQGSQESIKQFKELLGKTEEIESDLQKANVSATTLSGQPNPRYQAALSELGQQGDRALTFEDLQGYSSELGAKLAGGSLPGDVYQAIKFVKEKIDAAKSSIAERNGVGAALQEADAFWRNYMDTFHDSASAVSQVRRGVGVVDPQHYAQAFVTGKSAETGVGKLKQFKTRHADEASAVADLALNLRKASQERVAINQQGIRARSEKPMPEMERVPTPTAEDIVAAKRKAVEGKAQELGGLRRFDILILMSSPVSALMGSLRGALAGPLEIAGEKGVAAAFNRPKVIEWIAKPTAADLAAIEKLPPGPRAELRANLQKLIDQETQQGRTPNVSPQVARTIGVTVTATRPVANRREALERLQAR